MMATGKVFGWSAICFLLFAGVREGRSEILTFQGEDGWKSWQKPFGLVEIGEQGQLRLFKFHKEINAVESAHRFTYESKSKGVVHGGIWEAGSSPETAERIIDGDPETFWRPDSDAILEDWAIEIDLGRAVLARQIRLTFPDQEGARPFRQFTAYISTGTRISVTEDLVLLNPAYRTTRPNQERSITIPLDFQSRDSTMVVDEGLVIDPVRESKYRIVQRIRIEAEEKSQDAALAEVEVLGVGDNVSVGTRQRGSFVNGINAVDPQNLFDGDMNTNHLIGSSYGSQGWKDGGVWFGVDLGAVFFIDDIFLYSFRPDEGMLGFSINGTGPGHTILYSEGQQSLGTILPVPEALDYTELLTHVNPNGDRLLYIRYMFRPRKMRFFFWHGIIDTGWGIVKWGEIMLFSPGYPAEVMLKSDFIDLGQEAGDDRPKIIKNLSWDADLPPDTRLRLRSRSGNTMAPIYTFYDKKGDAITEEKWKSSPKVIRGPVDTSIVVGEDWGEWSNFYQSSKEPFKSESPRRFVQLEMLLSTEDPQVAPVVERLSIEYEDALLQEARGRISPRQVRANVDTRFTYTLWPQSEAQDDGFDLLRFTLPGQVDVEGVEVQVGDSVIAPAWVEMRDDSLLVALPERIRGGGISVGFTTRVLDNATVFALDLGSSGRPGLWQSVEPAERRSNVVMLPEMTGSRRLIGDLRIAPAVFTPNGDGVNDQAEISFVVFKLAASEEPRVQIYDLTGRMVRKLDEAATISGRSFTWSGRDQGGELVPPGIYLCRIDLGAEAGVGTELRPLMVAY